MIHFFFVNPRLSYNCFLLNMMRCVQNTKYELGHENGTLKLKKHFEKKIFFFHFRIKKSFELKEIRFFDIL